MLKQGTSRLGAPLRRLPQTSACKSNARACRSFGPESPLSADLYAGRACVWASAHETFRRLHGLNW
jgi:hypothetical protein